MFFIEYEYDEVIKFFEWDGGIEGNGCWLFKEEMEGDFKIIVEKNFSEVDVLRLLERDWYSVEDIELDVFGISFSDLFLMLLFWLLVDLISWFFYLYER